MVGAVGGGVYRREPRTLEGLSATSSSSSTVMGRGSRNGTPNMCVANSHAGGLGIGGLSLGPLGAAGGSSSVASGSPNSRESTPAAHDTSHGRPIVAPTLPVHLFSFRGELVNNYYVH